MAYLHFFKGSKPRRVELKDNCVTLGRGHDRHVVLEGEAVSRDHAWITRHGDIFVIEDRGSRNRTYVNRALIVGPTPLADRDTIKICHHHFSFHSGPPEDSKHKVVVTETESESTRIKSALDSTPSSDRDTADESRSREKLNAVIEINRNLAASLRVDQLADKVLDSLFQLFSQSDRGYILLKNEEGDELDPKAVKNRKGSTDTTLHISRNILEKVLQNGLALLVEDAVTDPALGGHQSVTDYRIHSIMCVPLAMQSSKPFGIIWLHAEDPRRRFSERDLDLLVSVVGMVAVGMERAKLHEQVVAQEGVNRDIDAGRKIQQTFLPGDWPEIPGYTFFANYEPAYTVGGDYYGFIPLPDNRLVITLGDVAGKGLAAALLMARLSSEVRYSATHAADPVAAVHSLNQIIQEDWPEDRFVTLLYMLLDLNDHTLSIVNAGHMPPLLRNRTGRVDTIGLDRSGPPLNTVAGYPYERVTLTLLPGSTLLVYTDGVTDARNSSGVLFGPERLVSTLRDAPADPGRAGDAVIREVRSYSAGTPQFDDIALICFGRNAQ